MSHQECGGHENTEVYKRQRGGRKNPYKCPCRALVQSSVADVRRLD